MAGIVSAASSGDDPYAESIPLDDPVLDVEAVQQTTCAAVLSRWGQLTTVQQWMCEQVLGIEPASEDEKPKPRRT
ncbi:hypothetical protein [Streptomyces sp. BK79]|uniref:hypothetical protein n=1 Tax=Streptomyces sp. BK79 TaxID=3350097 RepID=UPI00376FA899